MPRRSACASHPAGSSTDADGRDGTLATIVNEEFVRQHLAVPQVTGLRLPRLIGGERRCGVPAEIVGVVANVLKDGNDKAPQPELYFVNGAGGERISGHVKLVIRTAGEPAALAPDVRALVRERRPRVVIDRIEPLATSRRRVARCAALRRRRDGRVGRRRDAARRDWPLRRAVVQRGPAESRARRPLGARRPARRPRAPRAARRPARRRSGHRHRHARRDRLRAARCRDCCSA